MSLCTWKSDAGALAYGNHFILKQYEKPNAFPLRITIRTALL